VPLGRLSRYFLWHVHRHTEAQPSATAILARAVPLVESRGGSVPWLCGHHAFQRAAAASSGTATVGHEAIAGPASAHDKLGYCIYRFGALGARQLCPVGVLSISSAILINFIAPNLLESH